jgi:hypothetical protein
MANDRDAGAAVTPWHLWLVGAVALLWNGMGTFLWAQTSFMPDAALQGLPADHSAYVRSLPMWSSFAWGLGVLAGLTGAVLLLRRRRLSVAAFAASLVGAVANMLVYITNPPPPGFFSPPLAAFIIGLALIQLWYAHRVRERGILH